MPALVSEESFARAQELLQQNKVRSKRRTITPSVVQGFVSCQKCGYAFSRTSTYTSARKLHYYKCIGSDSWRKLGGPVCDNRMVRQDLLDQIVWTEVLRLLEDPTLIQQELDRRLAAARSADPTKRREQSLQRELTRVDKGIERLLNAYQEELLSLEQLRERMPLLRQREHTLRAELQAIADQAADRVTFLRLAETLAAFLGRLRSAADTLDVVERQRIVRLVVKDILIGDDTIVIRHCIPLGLAPPPESGPATPGRPHGTSGGQSYLLRKGSALTAVGESVHAPLRAGVEEARAGEAPRQSNSTYVLLDFYSRYVVGWLVAEAENAALARALIEESCHKHGITRDTLTLHSDRGSPMRAKTTAELLVDLGVAASFSRPRVSNDNPFSEAQFKTLKYRPEFPERFDGVEHARTHLREFFAWYNNLHRHSSIGFMTPASVHFGRSRAPSTNTVEAFCKRPTPRIPSASRHASRYHRRCRRSLVSTCHRPNPRSPPMT